MAALGRIETYVQRTAVYGVLVNLEVYLELNTARESINDCTQVEFLS